MAERVVAAAGCPAAVLAVQVALTPRFRRTGTLSRPAAGSGAAVGPSDYQRLQQPGLQVG